MGNTRNQKTNYMISTLCSLIEASKNADFGVPITILVDGQLISGTLISEREFYKLPINEPLVPIYEIIQKEKMEFFTEDGGFVNPNITDDEIANIPDALWQRFAFLKDARYITGTTFLPSESFSGTAIKVRVSDISAMNAATFSAAKP